MLSNMTSIGPFCSGEPTQLSDIFFSQKAIFFFTMPAARQACISAFSPSKVLKQNGTGLPFWRLMSAFCIVLDYGWCFGVLSWSGESRMRDEYPSDGSRPFGFRRMSAALFRPRIRRMHVIFHETMLLV